MENKNFIYSYTSMTLWDVLEEYPNLLDDMSMLNIYRTAKFKDMFKSVYGSKSIGAETPQLFKKWINDVFMQYRDYYNELLDVYEKELNYDDGYVSVRTHNDSGSATGTNTSDNTSRYIDLPNKTTSGDYDTNRTINNGNSTTNDSYNKDIVETLKGSVNVIEQREKALKYIKNIYKDFVDKFSDCFACIYG